MRAAQVLLLLLPMACSAPPTAPQSTPTEPHDEAQAWSGPEPDRSWAGAGAFDFTFSDLREEQGFSDCEVHYTLRWTDEVDVPCNGCAIAGAVALQVADDACPWQDWAAELEPHRHHYVVHPDTETLYYFDGEGETDMRDLGWELTWGESSVHLLGMSTDHTYYAVEARTLRWSLQDP